MILKFFKVNDKIFKNRISDETNKPLNILQFKTIFYMSSLILTFSIIAFAVEMFYEHYLKINSTKNDV